MRLVVGCLKRTHATRICTITLVLSFLVAVVRPAYGWSNGYSSDPNNPDYGTHDFLAHHALDWVPDDLDFWLRDNLTTYLYGTELPDNANAPLGLSLIHISEPTRPY